MTGWFVDETDQHKNKRPVEVANGPEKMMRVRYQTSPKQTGRSSVCKEFMTEM